MDVGTCRHLIEDLLSSYVDGELDDTTSHTLELHMQMCPPCAAFFRTFVATKRCCRSHVVERMPQECETSLWRFLQSELGSEVRGEPPVDMAACRCGPGSSTEPPKGA